MKILVTGSAGFIGPHTAETLRGIGHYVVGIDNFSDYYDPMLKRANEQSLSRQGISIINADLADESCYSMLSTDFDYIFHFAAQPGISATTGFDTYMRNNVEATHRLLEFAVQNKCLRMFVNISTSSVYGLTVEGNETVAPQPASYYGLTKLTAEQLVLSFQRMHKLRACSLRLFSVYGPRERPDKLFTKLVSSILLDKKFPLYVGSEKHVRSFTYVGDIVQGIVSVLAHEQECDGEVINLGTEEEHSTQYGIDCIAELLRKEPRIGFWPARAGDQLHTSADITKARRLLGYNPQTSLMQGLAMQVWWCENYLLQAA